MDNLTETMKKAFLLGIGAAALTAEKSKEMIDDLVKKGEITVDQGKVLNEELKHKAQEKVTDSLLNHVDKLSAEDRAALKAKLEALDKEETEE